MDIKNNSVFASDEDDKSNVVDLRLALLNINIFNVEIKDFQSYTDCKDGNMMDDGWLVEKISYEFLLHYKGGQRWIKNVAFYLEHPSDLTFHDFKEQLIEDVERLRDAYRDVEAGNFGSLDRIKSNEA